MKIGIVPPLPPEPFFASEHEAANLWASFYLDEDPQPYFSRADSDGVVMELSPWARHAYGEVLERGLDTVYLPEPPASPDISSAMRLLGEKGVEIRPFKFPLLRNLDRFTEALGGLCKSLTCDAGAVRCVIDQWSHARMTIRKMDGIQSRNAAYPSLHYVQAFARAMDPGGSMEEMKRDVERRFLEFQGLGQEKWVRLGICGLTPRRPELFAALDKLHAVVVYDEWGSENCALSPLVDLPSLWHQCSLPYGLKPRQERIAKEISLRNIRGMIWGAEDMSKSLRDESFFRSSLGLPLLACENRRSGDLTREELDAVARFVDSCTVTS